MRLTTCSNVIKDGGYGCGRMFAKSYYKSEELNKNLRKRTVDLHKLGRFLEAISRQLPTPQPSDNYMQIQDERKLLRYVQEKLRNHQSSSLPRSGNC